MQHYDAWQQGNSGRAPLALSGIADIRCELQGLVCHVGFVADGQQYVIPTAYARVGEMLYIHGSAVSRMLKTLTVCRHTTMHARCSEMLQVTTSSFAGSARHAGGLLLSQHRCCPACCPVDIPCLASVR